MNNFIFGDRGWTGWTIYRKDNSHIQAKKLSENVVFFGWGGSIYIYICMGTWRFEVPFLATLLGHSNMV